MTKSYKEVIAKLRSDHLDKYYSGANDTRIPNLDLVAFIYDVKLSKVEKDIYHE